MHPREGNQRRPDDEAKPTTTVANYPIVAALVKAEDIPGVGANRTWHSINPQQEQFITNTFTQVRSEVASIPEIESVASHSVFEINAFLRQKGFSIQLDEMGDPEAIAAASVLDLIVEWEEKGRAIRLSTQSGEYDGVSIGKQGVSVRNSRTHNHPIAELETKSGDQVFMTVLDTPPLEDSNLVNTAQRIQTGFDWTIFPEHAGVVFPMVDLDQKVDCSWIEGLATKGEDGKPVIITQALQQNILKMNETGAQAKSGFAFGAMRGIEMPKPPLVIDRPFLIWFVREGLKQPLFVGYIKEDSWKNPGEISATPTEA